MDNLSEVELNILQNQYNVLNEIIHKVKQIHIKPTARLISKNFGIINYSDLKDSWDVKYYVYGKSKRLELFKDKVVHMIANGHIPQLFEVLNNIKNNKQRIRKFKNKHNETINCGKGHFRLGESSITLNIEEIDLIKQFFKL